MEMSEKPFCGRCKEDFDIADKGAVVTLGFLYPVSRFSVQIRKYVRDEVGDWKWLCGNCYFDILDILEDREASK
jgi:hypothetical protein